MFLGQQFPVTYGHVLFVLSWVQPFLDANGLEIGFPKVLKNFLVFGYQVILQDTGDEMGLSFVFEGHFFYRFQVVIEAVFSLDVVDQPWLVCKSVSEMADGEWQYII